MRLFDDSVLRSPSRRSDRRDTRGSMLRPRRVVAEGGKAKASEGGRPRRKQLLLRGLLLLALAAALLTVMRYTSWTERAFSRATEEEAWQGAALMDWELPPGPPSEDE